MFTINDAIDHSTLNARCRTDLLGTVDELELHCATLPKRRPTAAAPHLPSCTFASTFTRSRKRCVPPSTALDPPARTAFEASAYFKRHAPHFDGSAPLEEPFRRTRDCRALTGREKDFVERYASAQTGAARAEWTVGADTPSRVAADAYGAAFRHYKGRDATPAEMREAERLFFAFAEDGTVGVVQRPHVNGPHAHISICNRRPVRCESQVYRSELPPVRGARDRFPGPVPIWSSTKNTYTMVGGDTYTPGLHNVHRVATVPSSKV